MMPIGYTLRAWRWTLPVVVLVAGGGALGAHLWHGYVRPLAMREPQVQVRIASGASARAIARAIGAAGVDLNELEFVAVARTTGATRSLRAGRYAIEQGMSMRSLVDMIRHGDVVKERLTIAEGTTFRELRQAFDAEPELLHQTAGMTDAQLLQAVGATQKSPEGLFAPDTYLFDSGSSDLDLYRRAYRMQADRIEHAWDTRAADLPYRNPYDALIMASLVEKETGQVDERRRVAGVFVNRERLGMPLQTDPSVIYGLGERFEGRLHHKDLATDTPYNTYIRSGLPPTPIALPGEAAIEAALHPETTGDLYFVARGDGTSEFSATLAAHQRAVDKFQKPAPKSAPGARRRSPGS